MLTVVYRASVAVFALSMVGCMSKPNLVWGYEDSEGEPSGKADDRDSDSGSTSGDTTASTTSPDDSTSGENSSGTDPAQTAGAPTESGSTGAGDVDPLPCDGGESALEWFDSLPLPATIWDEYTGSAATPTIAEGRLHVGVDFVDAMAGDAYWHSTSVQTVPGSGIAGLELVSIPPVGTEAEVMLGLRADGWFVYFEVFDGELLTMILDPMGGYEVRERVSFDPMRHHWIRLDFDAPSSTLVFQTSGDAVTWQDFDTVSSDMFDLSTTRLRFGSGAWGPPVVTDSLAVIDNVFICPR